MRRRRALTDFEKAVEQCALVSVVLSHDDDDPGMDADMDGLWTQLQQALATRRALQRQIAAAQRTTTLWEAHRESVQQLASSHDELLGKLRSPSKVCALGSQAPVLRFDDGT